MTLTRQAGRVLCGAALAVVMSTVVSVGAAAPASASGGNTFETPVVTPNSFQAFFAGQTIGPWTVTRDDVHLIGAGFWQAADGVQSLDLDGGLAGAIAMTISTVPLVTYRISYALAGNPASGPTIKTGQVLINGHVVQTFSFDITGKTFANMGYVHKHVHFLATGLSATIEFSSTTSPSGFGPVLDDIDIDSCLLVLCLG
jgi:choice-of-anchor C domain-containing protein